MRHKPTAEQQAVIDSVAAGESSVVQAVAGAGKTSTFRMAAAAAPRNRFLYVAFSRPMADEAKATMPRNVESRTYHSLAYRDVGYRFRNRLDAPRMPAKQAVEIMYAGGRHMATRVLNSPVDLGGVMLRPTAMARIALQAVERYCQSADDTIGIQHLPHIDGIKGLARDALADVVLPIAELAWADLSHPAGKLRHTGDHYVKVWALGRPYIPAPTILFDEAQDANPVIVKVLTDQQCAQLVAVGDSCQQLFAWRGAVDALAAWPADRHLTLSQSFRFGQAVADRANQWLELLQAGTRVVGAPWLDSTVGPVDAPDAVLCRTNAGAMSSAMEHLRQGRRVHLVGGGASIAELAKAADKLMHGERCDHPDLAAFGSWDEVIQYVAEDDGGDLAPLVKLINDYGTEEIIATADQLVPRAADADVVVSTGHRSKGLQWPAVAAGDDFREPVPQPYPTPASPRRALVLRKAELMLAYVAVTRAEKRLDDRGLSWVDRINGWGLPIVLAGEPGREQAHPPREESRLAQAVRLHPEAILPDVPDPVQPIDPPGPAPTLTPVPVRQQQPAAVMPDPPDESWAFPHRPPPLRRTAVR